MTRRVLVSGAGKQSQSSLAQPVQRTIATTAAAILIMLSALPSKVAAESIESALARAYQGNPQLNAQRAIVRQNDEGVAQALSGYRPTLSATASVGEQYTNQTGVFPAVPPALPNSLAYTIKGVTTPRSLPRHPRPFTETSATLPLSPPTTTPSPPPPPSVCRSRSTIRWCTISRCAMHGSGCARRTDVKPGPDTARRFWRGGA